MGNGRGLGTQVRLVSPAPILVNTGQQGKRELSWLVGYVNDPTVSARL